MTISGSSFCCAPLPIFAGEDYDLWRKKMVTFFISQGLWNLVQNGKTLTALTALRRIYKNKEDRKDAQALYYIQQAIAPTIFPKIVSFLSAKPAWDFLEAEYNTKFLEDTDFHAIKIPENLDPSIWTHAYYGEIPKGLRDLNIPRLISIGPLHHGRPELANMQIRKLHCAKHFLNRTGKQKDLFVGFIKQHEESIRGCYSKLSYLSRREYVEMILLDSFFIFDFFLRAFFLGEDPDNSSAHYEVRYRKNILVDLMLFENQLPLSLLFEICKIAFHDVLPDILTSFTSLCVRTFKVFNDEETSLDSEEVMKQVHFTGLVRLFKCTGVSAEMKITKSIRTLRYAARKLSEFNVKFFGIVCGSLTDIRFEKRVLNLPNFTVDNTTERVYDNLIALEQCDDQFKEKSYICSYILLLWYLMKNSDDVAVLVKGRVIVNELGSNQAVVDMFNRLRKSITTDHFYYADLCGELDDYCSSWKGWRNYCRKLLKDGYFTNIWRGTATISAVILLLLTLTQTITSIMQVM